MGMIAIGAGGIDAAVVMAGHPFAMTTPRVVGVEIQGALPEWVQSKDIILELLRRRGVRGGVGSVFEFYGAGLATLSATDRATIANMIAELGATGAVFPSDERTREWLVYQGREGDFRQMTADESAAYDETEVIDLGALVPLIAKPQSPGNVVPVSEIEGPRPRRSAWGARSTRRTLTWQSWPRS